MSPNGTLMAYSTPVDIKELRDQAALISMAWKEHEASRKLQSSAHDGAEDSTAPLETLTIETQHNNIIVRALQPKLLLVLVGGVPPSRKASFKITAEAHGDQRYPASDVPEQPPASQPQPGDSSAESSLPSGEDGAPVKQKAASILSTMSQRERDIKVGALHIQRKKIDALTDFIRADFDAKGFVMPDDSSFP